MTANQIYRFVQFLSNKTQSGNITPSEFNLAWERAERELFNDLYGSFASVEQMDVPRLAYERTISVADALNPFKVTPDSAFPTTDGRIEYPDDYVHFISLSAICGLDELQNVELIKDQDWANRTTSALIPPSKQPICNLRSDHIRVIPRNNRFYMTYLRTPATPKWAYTLDANNRPVYDSANSVSSEFPDFVHNEIVARICSYLGINLSREDLISYSENKSNSL